MAKRAGDEMPVGIPFPILGVDRGDPLAFQPELTTADLLNVRAIHSGDRRGGGKRAGLVRAMASQAGSAGSRRLNTTLAFQNQSQPALTGGTQSDNEVEPTVLGDGRDVGPGWASYHKLGNLSGGDSPEFKNNIFTIASGIGTLRTSGNFTTAASGIVAVEPTINFSSITLNAVDQADDTGFGNDGPNNSAVQVGPFIRGEFDLNQILLLSLVRTDTNQVTPRVIEFNEGTATTRWEGDPIALGNTGAQSECTLTLEEISTAEVRVVITWASQGVAVDTTVAIPALGDSFHFRSGIFSYGTDGRTHEVISWTVTRLEETFPATTFQISGTDPNVLGSDRYFIPDGWTSVHHAPGTNTVTTEVGPQQFSTASLLGPAIDTTTGQLTRPSGDTTTSRRHFLTRTAEMADRLAGVFFVKPFADASTTNQSFSFYSRISDDFDSYLEVDVVCSLDTTAAPNNTNQYLLGGFTTGINLRRIVNGSVTTLAVLHDVLPDSQIVANAANPITVIDTGEATGAKIQVYVGGILFIDFTIDDADIDPASFPELYDASGVSNRRVGMGPQSGTTSGNRVGLRYRFANVALQDEGGFDDEAAFGETAIYVTGFTDGRVETGLLGSALSPHSGTSFASSLKIQGALLGSKWHCVNSVSSLIVDPIALTVSDWGGAVTAGTLPQNCALAATYRGRIVLAKQPDNGSIWYLSRSLDPLDWDFGAEPIATTAFAGVNAAVGQPGDTIIALIPYLDDYLVFGCASSLWYMEGDPGTDGIITNLSKGVGVLGPRAWCFDDLGNLYFLGSSGLYVLQGVPGRPTLISGVKLRGILDRVNANTTLIQLAYDAFDKTVNIYLTPSDGVTAGTHVIYDTRVGDITQGWFLDQYPVAQGPWSVAEIYGAVDADRRVLLGGNDGWIRKLSDAAFDDDGSAITAFFDSAPMAPFGDRIESLCKELFSNLNAAGGAVTWEWYVADSAVEVRDLSSSPRRTGTWGGAAGTGFQFPTGMRERGGAHKLRVTQTSALAGFQIDSIGAIFTGEGRRR